MSLHTWLKTEKERITGRELGVVFLPPCHIISLDSYTVFTDVKLQSRSIVRIVTEPCVLKPKELRSIKTPLSLASLQL
jgi:hypothetical protein